VHSFQGFGVIELVCHTLVPIVGVQLTYAVCVSIIVAESARIPYISAFFEFQFITFSLAK